MIILGIDPGFAIVGYGLVQYQGNRFSVLDYGIIKTNSNSIFSERLLAIDVELNTLIARYKTDAFAIEELFFNKNTKTALSVAQGRGVAILSAAKVGLTVNEYTPLQVKQAVAGYGRACKEQVQTMVKVLLNLNSIPKPDDAADALAVAICHAHCSGSYGSYN